MKLEKLGPVELLAEAKRLQELLRCEMANHQEFRTKIYSDSEFKPILERREKERQGIHSEQYLSSVLDNGDELELVKDQCEAW